MRLFCVFVQAVSFLILYGFTPVQALEAPKNRILKFGVHVSAMGNLDPHFAAGSQDRAVADMVFNALLRYEPGEAPKIEPDLAEKIPGFELRNGRQIWTVQLKKGVMFHQGPQTEAYELTADDVVFSLNKSKDEKFCAYAGGYAGMTVAKTGPYSLEIILENPVSPILFFAKIANYGGGFIVSKKAIERLGYDEFKAHPIGTGPFSFNGYNKPGSLSLNSHAAYFRGTPKLDGVEIHFIPDINERQKAFESGDLHVITGSGKKGWLAAMEGKTGIFIDAHGVGEVASIYLNTRMAPMDDIRVRKAVAYALDREGFLKTTNPRLSGSVYSQVPQQFLPGGLSREDVKTLDLEYTRDLDKARQLLKDAGYPDGFSLDLVSSEKRLYKALYEVLRQQLSAVGITCNIKVMPHSDMHKHIRNNPIPMVIYAAWRPNADAYLTRFFHSDSIVLTGKKPDTNFARYDKIDDLIQGARLEVDPEKQINLWMQAQIRILSDMAAYPLGFIKQLYIRKTFVDYGHPLVSSMALYPQFTEKTTFRGAE